MQLALEAAMKTTKTKGNFHQILAPLLFLLPNILIFTTFIIIPLFRGLSMSFMDWGVFTSPKFVGLKNFRLLFQDQVFIIYPAEHHRLFTLCSPVVVGGLFAPGFGL